MNCRRWLIPILALLVTSATALAVERSIILQSTTSTANSGLYDHLLPIFTEKSGITVHVVAVGTGQAIKNAQNGDGDVLLVHARSAEEAFVAEGYGVERFDVMYNDFIVVGPPTDPAKVNGMKDAAVALRMIADAKVPFASRGDNSGTHKKEVALWQRAGVDVASSFKNKGDYVIAVEGSDDLFNQYGVILVDPDRHPRVKAVEGQAFIDWILGAEGQAAIATYTLGGQQLFFPNAK
jgi:tungstate transport system substrate-binding protein